MFLVRDLRPVERPIGVRVRDPLALDASHLALDGNRVLLLLGDDLTRPRSCSLVPTCSSSSDRVIASSLVLVELRLFLM